MFTLATWKLIGVALYLAVLLGIGVVASRRMSDVKEYYAGGKKLGFWAVAFSARATGESAWLLLGLTGMGAALGVHAFWVVVGEVLGVMGAWLLLSRRFKRLTDRYDSITVPDYLESRFRDSSHLLRMVAAVALTIFVTIYVSAQIDATGVAFEKFIGLSYMPESLATYVTSGDGFLANNAAWFFGILIGFVVVMAYSVTGGFVAVVWSDVFQGTLMFFGLVTLPLVGLWAAGGPTEVWTNLVAIDPGLTSPFGPNGFSIRTCFGIAGLALIGLGFLGSPQIFVRFLALKSENEITKGAAVAFVWTLLADSGAVLVGVIGRSLIAPDSDTAKAVAGTHENWEGILPHMVEAYLAPFLVGLFIAIVLSAIMSTVDSLLVVASSAAVRDVYQQILNPTVPGEKLVRLSQITTLVLALFALAIALTVGFFAEERSVFWFVIFGWSGIAATFCPTIILSLFWTKMTRNGALVAMITGFLCVPLFKFGPPVLFDHFRFAVFDWLTALGELPLAFACSGLAAIVFSLVDGAGAERLAEAAQDVREAGA